MEDIWMNVLPAAVPDDYRADITRAVGICKEEGCREVYVFGSVATGRLRPWSDLDIGVRGCPSGRFYHLLGRLMDELTHPVDLVDLDLETRMADFLEQEGQLLHVG
jgi:predicted nucleotidyltransferase